MHIFGTAHFSRDVYITLKIQNSECYSSETHSTYIVYLGALTFENTFLSYHVIHSDQRTAYDESTGTNIFSIRLDENSLKEDPEACYARGGDPCVPRADVIYIQYQNEPEDSWSISHIEVEVQFRLWPGKENWHVFNYEHSVAKPCQSWMDRVGLFQIGPRNGLFFPKDELPSRGEWVRDWV